MIQTSSAAIIGANNTRLIELEDTATSINSDSKGMSPQLCLDIVNVCCDLSDIGDISDSLGVIMSTGCFTTIIARGVWVFCISHDTLLFLESPSSVHPATTAAPEAVVFAEKILVALVVPQGAINKLLLREAHGRGVVLLGDCTFKCGVGCEGPAGATIALILDGTHEAIFDVVDGGSVGNQATATTSAHHVVATAKAMHRHVRDTQLGVFLLQTKMRGLELRSSHI